MATADELFGSSNKDATPWFKFTEIGQKVVGVLVDEPRKRQDWNPKSRKAVWIVKNPLTNKWEKMDDGDFDKDQAEFFKPEHVVIKFATKEGEVFQLGLQHVGLQEKVKQAMIDGGIPLEKGTTIGIKWLGRGNEGHQYEVKLAKAE